MCGVVVLRDAVCGWSFGVPLRVVWCTVMIVVLCGRCDVLWC